MANRTGTPKFQIYDAPTYTVAENIAAGQLVEARSAGVVGVGAAASVTVLGVAEHGALLADAAPGSEVDGNTIVDMAQVGPYNPYVTVGVGVYPVQYAAACTFGTLLKAAAAGAVTPFVSGTDTNPSLIVGRCVQPGGVSGAGVALARITP